MFRDLKVLDSGASINFWSNTEEIRNIEKLDKQVVVELANGALVKSWFKGTAVHRFRGSGSKGEQELSLRMRILTQL